MTSRILLSCLALFISAPLFATDTGAGHPTVPELREALFHLHANELETLTWRLPNEDEVVPFDRVDYIRGGCLKPVPVRLQQPQRFVVRCETILPFGFERVTVRTNTLWTYSEGEWEPGHLYWTQISPTNRRLYEEKQIWETKRTANLTPLTKQLAEVSGPVFPTLGDALSELGDRPLTIGSGLSRWNHLEWPEGLVAVGRDNRFLVQKGSLEGIGRITSYANDNGSLPDNFRGAVRLGSTVGFIVGDFDKGSSHFMLALAELKETDWQRENLIWEDGQYGVQVVEVKRNLGR